MEHLVRRRYKLIADPQDVRLGERLQESESADVAIVGAPMGWRGGHEAWE